MKAITIFGNIGKDPVLRTTQNGDKVCGFGMAVTDGWGDNKRTLWFDVSVWGKRGQTIADNCRKGDKICVTGDFSTREHEGKTYLTVKADNFTFGGSSGGSGNAGVQHNEDHGPKGDGYGAGGTPMDDDIPFAPQVL